LLGAAEKEAKAPPKPLPTMQVASLASVAAVQCLTHAQQVTANHAVQAALNAV
jgi:hypothetical protein